MRPSAGGIIAVVALCLLLGWWLSRPDGRLPPVDPAQAGIAAAGGDCRLPPRLVGDGAPLQTDVPADLGPFQRDDARLTPLAGFSIAARVLGREDYRMDREARYSPLDLALGWGRMTEDAVLDRLQLSQSGRWYRYRWQSEPPIPREEIARSSANMHMIPADDRVAAALADIDEGDRIRIDGWLVQVETPEGWRWRSSTRRDDQGNGACELVYVCAVTML